MSNIAKLKKKAAEHEAKKQFDKALEVYEQVLATRQTGDEERDVALYNRVGDLHYRLGNTEQALTHYEQAADFYAEAGFFNNAIALCNKILRYSPARTIIYYKLGIISAKKGFTSDAKQNFLEYADRMQRIGKMDEAFRALKEFADLCPGQDDVRLMLADQLGKAGRKNEALEQLELLYDALEADGRTTEAGATLERMKALDPAFKPRRSIVRQQRKQDGLVFLDLDVGTATPPAGTRPQPEERAEPRVEAPEPSGDATHVAEPETSATGESERPAERDPFDRPAAQVEGPSAADVLYEGDLPPASLHQGETEVSIPEGFESTSLHDEPAVDAEPGPNELTFITPPEEVEGDAPPVYPPAGLPMIDVQGSAYEPAPDEPVAPASRNGDSTHAAGHSYGLAPDDDFVDLGEWLERNRTPVSTRMVTHDEVPLDGKQKDFAEMLDKFKAGISKNVDEADFESHYDLGIAFREMGLVDEAIGSFQKAAHGPALRVRACEAIGQCFLDKGEAGVTYNVLLRLIREPGMTDPQLLGVLYLLGSAAEALGRRSEAADYFQRVQAVQIGFRDTSRRLSALAG